MQKGDNMTIFEYFWKDLSSTPTIIYKTEIKSHNHRINRKQKQYFVNDSEIDNHSGS